MRWWPPCKAGVTEEVIYPAIKDCAVILRIVAESIDTATMRRVTGDRGIAQDDRNQTLIAG